MAKELRVKKKGSDVVKKLMLVMTLVIVLAGCTSDDYKYEDGSYIGEAEGHHGIIQVKVTIEKNRISEINILKEQEIPGLKEIVYKKVPKKMIKYNTWKVDGISGATLTSNGLKEAVKVAIEDARVEE